MSSLTFEFKTSECNGWPKLQVLVDNDLYEDHLFSSAHESITIPIELLAGEHEIEFEIYDKTSKNTVVDSTGSIIQDQLIELIDIYVNDIKLPEWFKYRGVYKFNNQEYPQATTWGCNGRWYWSFATPLITWAIDTKIKNSEKYNPPEISQISRTNEKLKRFNILAELLKGM